MGGRKRGNDEGTAGSITHAHAWRPYRRAAVEQKADMTWDEYLPNVKTSWRTDLTNLPRLMSLTFVPMIGRYVPDSTCMFDKFLGRTGT